MSKGKIMIIGLTGDEFEQYRHQLAMYGIHLTQSTMPSPTEPTLSPTAANPFRNTAVALERMCGQLKRMKRAVKGALKGKAFRRNFYKMQLNLNPLSRTQLPVDIIPSNRNNHFYSFRKRHNT